MQFSFAYVVRYKLYFETKAVKSTCNKISNSLYNIINFFFSFISIMYITVFFFIFIHFFNMDNFIFNPFFYIFSLTPLTSNIE